MNNARQPIEASTLFLTIERAARRSLWAELSLYPKPGLVSPVDNGSHTDMTMNTLMRSIHSMRYLFGQLAELGAAGADFSTLQRVGIEAERRMTEATNGINTHRGAVFTMGLLAAAIGVTGPKPTLDLLVQTIREQWGDDILASTPVTPTSHGAIAVSRHNARGARFEAAHGFPTLMTTVLPHLLEVEEKGADQESAMVQCLFAAMATLDDTNILHRGGLEGLAYVKSTAQAFLDRGGVFKSGWRDEVICLHQTFIRLNLSPGGAADMLAAALFVRDLT